MRDFKLFAGTTLAVVGFYAALVTVAAMAPRCDGEDDDEDDIEEPAEARERE